MEVVSVCVCVRERETERRGRKRGRERHLLGPFDAGKYCSVYNISRISV